MWTLQRVIETRHRYYLEIQVERLLALDSLNEDQWTALHYMQFVILMLLDDDNNPTSH